MSEQESCRRRKEDWGAGPKMVSTAEPRQVGGYKRTIYETIRRINPRPFLLIRKRRALALIILLCLIFSGPLRQWRIRYNLETAISGNEFCIRGLQGVGEDQKSPGWLLVEETGAAIAEAGGVPCTFLSAKERNAWNVANPCAGREHLLRLWTQQKRSPPLTNTTTTQQQGSEPSALLQVLFDEYANLHRTCTHGGDTEYVKELFQSDYESSSTPCKFAIVEFGTQGLGNLLLWLVSAYQYALLTKRVLLIDTRSNMDELVCEPFPGSSWALPSNFSYSSDVEWPEPVEFQRVWDEWENRGLVVEHESVNAENPHEDGLTILDVDDMAREKSDTNPRIRGDFRSWMSEIERFSTQSSERRFMTGEDKMSENSAPLQQPHFHHVRVNEGWAPHARFFCDNEHERLQQVKWINFIQGCLYFLPDLFAIPSLQPILEDLFPNRDPVTHLLRQLALPVDSIWERMRDLVTKEFSSASKVVGIQVRYRDGFSMYADLNSLVNRRISQCGLDHDLITYPAAASAVIYPEGPLVIFIASLYPGLRDHLASEYQEILKKGESTSLKLVQLSEIGFQSSDLESDQQAFLEMIALSLVDELLTSPLSTYGQIAQGLGGLTPWLIDFQDQGESSRNCVRGQSTDACFQYPPISKLTCPFNEDVNGKEVTEVVPYLKRCQDLADGLQLVPR